MKSCRTGFSTCCRSLLRWLDSTWCEKGNSTTAYKIKHGTYCRHNHFNLNKGLSRLPRFFLSFCFQSCVRCIKKTTSSSAGFFMCYICRLIVCLFGVILNASYYYSWYHHHGLKIWLIWYSCVVHGWIVFSCWQLWAAVFSFRSTRGPYRPLWLRAESLQLPTVSSINPWVYQTLLSFSLRFTGMTLPHCTSLQTFYSRSLRCYYILQI